MAPQPKPAMAEALASDEGPEFEEFREYHREHVPYWTLEPGWINWCDQEYPEKSIQEDTQRKFKLGEYFIEELKARYDGSTLNWLQLALARHGYWWRRDCFVSGRSPTKLSIYDTPVENSQLELMRSLPVRNRAGHLVEIQACLFRNTQDPDVLRKEVFPNRPQARPPLKDSCVASGWERPQERHKRRFGKDFFSWLRGEITFRGLHQQFGLPLWLLGSRAAQYPPPPSSGLWSENKRTLALYPPLEQQ